MKTISILNNYRISVANDPITFRILSHCFASGPSSEQEIQSDDLAPADIALRVVNLFRANLLRKAGNSRWATTELANALLCRMGVARQATEWLVDSTSLDPEDCKFLKAVIRLADEENFWSTVRTHLTCRFVIQCCDTISGKEASDQERNETLFSAIIGLNTRCQSLGAERFVSYIGEISPYFSFSSSAMRNRFIEKVDSCIETCETSNLHFATGHAGQGKSQLLTWVRLLAAVQSGQPDQGMACLTYPPSNGDTLWSSLKVWKSDLTESSRRILFCPNTSDSQSTDLFVRTRLKYSLERFRDRNNIPPGARMTNFDYFIDQESLRSPQESVDVLIGMLRSAIDKDFFDLLDNETRTALCESMEEAALLYRQALSPSNDKKGPIGTDKRSRQEPKA